MLSRRGVSERPPATVAVGAVTPPFDGISVGVLVLSVTEGGFEIEVEVTGRALGLGPFDLSVGDEAIAWFAADDRGNHYLGAPEHWGGDGVRRSGTIGFWPGLDPRATRVDLMPTARAARAVIRVPLGGGSP